MKPATSSHKTDQPPASPAEKRILRVAVPTPLYGSFDYLIPAVIDPEQIRPGCRVRVSFGRQQLVGLALELRSHSDYPASKLKPLLAVLDAVPVLGSELLELLQWAAGYYHHPLGEVINAALPAAAARRPGQ